MDVNCTPLSVSSTTAPHCGAVAPNFRGPSQEDRPGHQGADPLEEACWIPDGAEDPATLDAPSNHVVRGARTVESRATKHKAAS